MDMESIARRVKEFLEDPSNEEAIVRAVAYEIAKVTIPPVIASTQESAGASREKLERHENSRPIDNSPHADPKGPRQPGNAGAR